MSDVYVDPQDFADPTNFVLRQQRQATASAITSLGDDPEKASRAQQLAEETGAHPALVYGNLENFEEQHKAALTAQLVNSNRFLRQYIDSHPLADKISNDDYGQLDSVSEKVEKLGSVESVLGAAFRGFKENFGAESLVEEHEKLAKMLASHPAFATSLMMSGLISAASGLATATRLFSGVVGGAAAGIGETYKQLGGNEAQANRLTRDLIIFAQVALSGQAGPHGPVAPEVTAAIGEASKLAKTIAPYAEVGKEPPVGLHPIIDEAKVQQAKVDANNLGEALKEAAKSSTRERNPDLFANYVRGITDGEIGISADAVRALYGEKPPVPGEGPLGFVGDLADQLRRAEATGGDIKVSVADWLAKVEPDVAKELKDHIRARPEGVTVEEGKALEKPETEPAGPIEAVRQSAGLQGVQERKLALKQIDTKQTPTGEAVHSIDIVDDTGKSVGEIDLAEEKGGKRLFIDDIRSPEGPQSLGPKAMRDVLEQLKEQFPNAETLEGMRVSGGRERANKANVKAAIDLTKIKPRKRPEQLELDVTRIEDKEAFAKASAIGMTVDQYKRYQKLIDKQHAEDVAYYTKRAEAEAKRRISKEWKEVETELRPEVARQVNAQPDVVADNYLRTGDLYGDKIKVHKIGEDFLTPEQKAALPEEFYSKDGIHPDDLASLVGHPSGAQLIDSVADLAAKRKASGMNPDRYRRSLIAVELDRQVNGRLGKRAEEILQEAKEQVLSETQEELLHEETLARAAEAGLEFSIDKDQYKAALKDFFDRQLTRDVSTDRALVESGRAGRAAEAALLKGDYAEAFRQKQRQYNAIVMANFAKGFEKEQAKFEKLAKRFSAREVASVAPEYTNWIHDILMRTGNQVKRSLQDLQEALARGEQKTLTDFVEYKEGHDMREVPVADFLLDPAFRKQVKDLTTAEFLALHDSVKALAKNGRDEQMIIKAGEEFDLNEKKKEMIEQLVQFKEKHYDATGGRWLGPLPPALAKPLRTYLVSHLQLESIFNRWDRGNPDGVFTQFLSRELSAAANSESKLEGIYATKLRKIVDKADLKERVPNELIRDPLGNQPIQMTRKNLRAVLLNVGNKSNFDKLARGYIGDLDKGEAGKAQVAAYQAQIMNWLHQHATKADWDWAQGIGDIFADIKKQSDTMYRSLTGGVEPESIPIAPIQTPHGEYKGWYYPIIHHSVWEGVSKKLMGGDPLEQQNYIRATTPAGYTKARTGYTAPLALDLDMMPVRMRQMLHDVAFRPAVIQAGKIFYDKDIRAAITKHYGTEYTKMLVPYLRDVANAANYRNDAQMVFTRFSEFMRQNIIATLIGLNPGTVLKHGPTAAVNSVTEVGLTNFLRAAKGLFSINETTGETNWAYALKTSEELQRRHRFYRETMGGAIDEIQGEWTMRDHIIRLGSYPVAMSDLLSAVPTWMAKYEAAMKEHGIHGDAVFEADRAVRRAHGSSVVTNRPQVMRTGPMGSWLASLYGFFNHIMNRQYELAWHAGDALDLVKEGEYKKAMAEVPALTGMLFSYVIFPAVIEELVTPVVSKDNESWGSKAAKGLAYTISASWIGIRDIVSAAVNGRDPSIGLMSTAYKTATDIIRDLKKDRPLGKDHAGTLIQHAATALGAATGWMNAQVGKSGRFIYNYANGIERPKGPWGWMVGLRFGTLKHHSQTYDQWMKGH